MSAGRQIPFAPSAGFLATAPEIDPYPFFPGDPLGRVQWAEEAPIKGAPNKVVLLILAHRADKEGKAWPSIRSLERWAGISRRGVFAALATLENRGWLVREARESRSSIYWPKAPTEQRCLECRLQLLPGTRTCPSCGLEGEGVQNLHGGVQMLHGGVQISHP